MFRRLLVSALLAPLVLAAACSASPPKFVVSAQQGVNVNLLVLGDASKDKLRTLVRDLKSTREHQAFSKLFPATTPNSRTKNPYSVVQVRVFSDPFWADEEHLTKSLEANVRREFTADFDAHVLAKYVYASLFAPGEYGWLGASPSAPGYEQIFATSSSALRATP